MTLTEQVDTEVFTLQADLCRNLSIVYNHKKYLGSIVQAGIYGLNVKFNDYPALNFLSGFEELKKEYASRLIFFLNFLGTTTSMTRQINSLLDLLKVPC